jgi:hypothetical protein
MAINFYWDESTGKVWLQIDEFDKEFLYQNFFTCWIRIKRYGLDRGKISPTSVVNSTVLETIFNDTTQLPTGHYK